MLADVKVFDGRHFWALWPSPEAPPPLKTEPNQACDHKPPCSSFIHSFTHCDNSVDIFIHTCVVGWGGMLDRTFTHSQAKVQ